MAVVHKELMSAFHKTATALFQAREFMDKGSIKRKDHVSSSSMDQNALLIPEVREKCSSR